MKCYIELLLSNCVSWVSIAPKAHQIFGGYVKHVCFVPTWFCYHLNGVSNSLATRTLQLASEPELYIALLPTLTMLLNPVKK